MKINKSGLKGLVEPFILESLDDEFYNVIRIHSSKLLTYNRFDIAIKLFFLEMTKFGVDFSTDLYKEHIRAFSLGKYTEPGQTDKNSIKKFILSFINTYESIKETGFTKNTSIIPLCKNGTIINGAHRTAAAIYLNQEVECVQLPLEGPSYDFKFFYNRTVSLDYLDMAANKFIEYSNNSYIALVWPSAVGFDDELDKLIPNVIYKKLVNLTLNGAHNLLAEVYRGEEWLGDRENNFSGVKGKLVECFKSKNSLRVIAFQSKSLKEVYKVKEKVRELFKIGKHSIHITDTKQEAIRISRLVFNENSIHFLNYARPNKFQSTFEQLNQFNLFLKENNISNNEVILDGSMVLSLYGIRKASDIDYLVDDYSKIVKKTFHQINNHFDELKYHQKTNYELIFNPKNYFYFNNFKFTSFDQLYSMKKKRIEGKDKYDLRLMKSFIEKNKLSLKINLIIQKLLYFKLKFRFKIVILSKKLKLYKQLRKVKRFLIKDKF